MLLTFYADKENDKTIYMQLYEYLKEEIIKNHIKDGEKLPSIREASKMFKLSKTTIENAYFQLLTEGYIENKSRKGYYVIHLSDFQIKGEIKESNKIFKNINIDLEEKHYKNEDVDHSTFEVKDWKKIYSRVLFTREKELYSSSDYQGEYELRKEISEFTNLARGANSSPEQIVIGAGVQYLIGILAGIIREDYNNAAVESPGYEKARYIFEDYSFNTTEIPVRNDGLNTEMLYKSNADVVYVSPSHQFPTGSLMPIKKRLQLLNWAKEEKSFIVEDDYDSLIRHESKPVPCLQGLDKNDRVIYLGSFSKILLPSLRISYMILPVRLLKKYNEIKSRYTQTSSKIEQMALEIYIKEGYLQKHINKIKRIYKKKINLIQEYIKNFQGNKIKVLSADSGLHIVLEVFTKISSNSLKKEFEDKNILIRIIEEKKSSYIISLSYSGLDFEDIEVFKDSLL
ncbi:MAG: PLP-dependent aminotransferase family protein [Bacillota bacterium]|nr:PLP-dependent aminotransferase family protein [Bacillota bacterium]